MFKKIVAVAIVVLAMIGIAKFDVQRKEANLRALERAALESEITMGMAPMSWTCKQFGMEFSVNSDGEPICHGVARFGADLVAENIAAAHLANSCVAVGGVARLDGTVASGAPTLAVRCTATRFGDRWQAAK